ncbi:Reverse transcriptase RNA-dependent DNA polymerase, partial [Macrophomina phaseolina MS6]
HQAVEASSSHQLDSLIRLPTPSPSATSDRLNSREEQPESSLQARQTQGTEPTSNESSQVQPNPEPRLDSETTPATLEQHHQPAPQASGGDQEQQSRLGRLMPVQYDTDPDPAASRGNRAPRGSEISSEINPNSIIQGKRTRRSAYITQLLLNQHSDQAWRTSFATALSTTQTPRRHRDTLPPEPKTFKELSTHPLGPEFLKAVEAELRELQGKGVWKVISVTDVQDDTKEVIPLTWVFKYKFDENGYLLKCKARICVRGDLQTTQEDTFAATLAFRIFRALMAIICAFDLETRQYDVVNAFPHVPLEQTTYCKPPEGITLKNEQVLQLLKALYGLKESPALWQRHFCNTLTELGLEPIPDAPCLYANSHLFVFFFVDDVIVAYHKDDERYAEVFQDDLFQRYEMRMMGEIQWFLALRIVRNRQERLLWLSQESYINSLITKYNVKEANAPATPLPQDEPLTPNEDSHATPQNVHTFQSKMGSVQFAAISTRADIAFAASALSAYLTNPSHRHLALAQRLLEYLGGTKKLALCFNGSVYQDEQNIFTISSDAAYANDQETRRSHQGSLVTLFGGPVDWKATKQPTVTTSTTEAELLALSETAKQCFWWKRFFNQLQFNPGHLIQIQCDNQMTLRLMEESVGKLTTKLRHVDIHHHWLRQEALAGNIHFRWTPTADMIADGLTKALPKQKHQAFVNQLGLTPLTG